MSIDIALPLICILVAAAAYVALLLTDKRPPDARA